MSRWGDAIASYGPGTLRGALILAAIGLVVVIAAFVGLTSTEKDQIGHLAQVRSAVGFDGSVWAWRGAGLAGMVIGVRLALTPVLALFGLFPAARGRVASVIWAIAASVGLVAATITIARPWVGLDPGSAFSAVGASLVIAIATLVFALYRRPPPR